MSAAVNATKTTEQNTARVITQVNTAVANADNVTSQGIQSLTLVHQARLTQLTRTAANVTTQYGASSPQAKAAKAAVTASQATIARLAIVKNQVALAPPAAPAQGWILYGHIYHSQLTPAAAYTVFFVDEQNAYLSAIGFAYTAADGSFHLQYVPDANAAALPQAFLEVVNAKAQPVYLSTMAFQPQLGNAIYQDVTLPRGEPVLGDPPAAIRAIAMPTVSPSKAGRKPKEEL